MAWINNTIKRDISTSYADVRFGIKEEAPLGTAMHRGKRYLASIISLVLGMILFYISAHYVGAFLPANKAVSLRIASINTEFVESASYKRVAKIVGEPKYKRVYLREGQAIEANYVLPVGAKMTITVLQCRRHIIREVFNCDVLNEQNTSMSKRVGSYKINSAAAGFYYFTETVDLENVPSSKREFAVLWKRN